MRFMMLVKATQDYEGGCSPNPQLMAAIAKMAEEATRAGQMIDTGGLLPSSQATRVLVSGGKTSLVDGPFAETKELVGGYAIFELPSREDAIRMARDFMQLHADILGPSYEGQLEIRPMFSPPPGAQKQA